MTLSRLATNWTAPIAAALDQPSLAPSAPRGAVGLGSTGAACGVPTTGVGENTGGVVSPPLVSPLPLSLPLLCSLSFKLGWQPASDRLAMNTIERNMRSPVTGRAR